MSEHHGAALPALGARLRSERLRRGVSLRGLARDIGVSASLLSQIETDKSRPSVSTLYAITSALAIPAEDLFGADGPDGVRSPGGDGDPAAGVTLVHENVQASQAPLVDPWPHGQDGLLVNPAARERLTLDSGVTWERLGMLPDAHFDFLLITYAPGGTSSSSGDLMRHRGTEYGYMLSGELVLTLGSEDHHLVAGDSVCFDSSMPHRLRNDGETPAVGVWFVLERG